MEFKAFLIKYAEIGIKGNNRRFFEDALVRQMKYALKPVGDFSIRKESGRIFVHANEERPDSFLIEKSPTGFNAYFI